jgi:hypothetical protein
MRHTYRIYWYNMISIPSDNTPLHMSINSPTPHYIVGPGIESRWGEIFRTCPDRPRGPLSLLYNEYRTFPGCKVRPGRAVDHSPPSSAEVMKEKSYTSTHPLGHTGPVRGVNLPLPLPHYTIVKIYKGTGDAHTT